MTNHGTFLSFPSPGNLFIYTWNYTYYSEHFSKDILCLIVWNGYAVRLDWLAQQGWQVITRHFIEKNTSALPLVLLWSSSFRADWPSAYQPCTLRASLQHLLKNKGFTAISEVQCL